MMEETDKNVEPGAHAKTFGATAPDARPKTVETAPCPRCGRANPSNRLRCLYCGEEFEIASEQIGHLTFALRRLEAWEKGFNLILHPRPGSVAEEQFEEAARVLNLERHLLQRIIEAQAPLPVARVESENEARLLRRRLEELDFSGFIVSDEALAVDKPPARLRGLEFGDDVLRLFLFNNDRIIELAAGDLRLIVPGVIFQKEVETTEKRQKGASRILEAAETASDEYLADIYAKDDSQGYRILARGFDFSCLGAGKGILVRENMQRLIAALGDAAPKAKLVDDYVPVRAVLGSVWEIEQRQDSQGLKKQGFGRYGIGRVASSSNLGQFTKFSRLQRHLL